MDVDDLSTKEFTVLTPFTVKEAAVEDKTADSVLKIAGYANWSGKDSDGKTYTDLVGDVVVPGGVDLSVWQSNPQILWQHNRNQTIGRGLKLEKRDDGLYIECEIHKDAMDEKDFYRVKSGLVSYFSIGFRTLSGEWKEEDGKEIYYITKSLLLENSVVSIPANSKSGFSVIKSIDGGWTSDSTKRMERAEAPATKTETPNKEVLPMLVKIKLADRFSAEEAEALKRKGVNVDQEVEVSLIDLIKEVTGEVIAGCTDQITAAVKEALAAAEADEAPAEEKGEEEEAAAGEEEEAAAGEEEEAKELSVGIGSLREALAELKALAEVDNQDEE